MSKAKWFVGKPSTGEIIAHQIMLPEFLRGTKMLYYIHQTPLSTWRGEGGSGFETTHLQAVHSWQSSLFSFRMQPAHVPHRLLPRLVAAAWPALVREGARRPLAPNKNRGRHCWMEEADCSPYYVQCKEQIVYTRTNNVGVHYLSPIGSKQCTCRLGSVDDQHYMIQRCVQNYTVHFL